MRSTRHLATDLDAPAQSRRLTKEWMSGHPRRDDAVLAVSEIVANAVKHGGQTARRSGLTLRHETGEEWIRISVSHQGTTFNPSSERDVHGLSLVDRVVDRWGIETIGPVVTVWFEIHRQKSEHDAGAESRVHR